MHYSSTNSILHGNAVLWYHFGVTPSNIFRRRADISASEKQVSEELLSEVPAPSKLLFELPVSAGAVTDNIVLLFSGAFQPCHQKKEAVILWKIRIIT